jgi:HK97 family phage major capsid protein
MPEDRKDVVDLVKREIERIGEDTKKLHDDMQRDLNELRTKAEAGEKANKEEITALQTSLSLKVEELDKKSTANIDKVTTALRRSALSGGGRALDDLPKTSMADALAFKMSRMSIRGEAEKRNVFEVKLEDGDVEGYDAYCKAWNIFLRTGEKLITDVEVLKALTTGSDPGGGYLVPAAQSSRIMTIVYETNPLAALATTETIGTDRIEIPIDEGEGSAGWVGEEEARPETGTALVGVQTIPVHEVYAKPKATQRLLEDASTDMEAWIANKNGSKMGRMEATAFITGNGVKRPRGILSYPAGTGVRGTIQQIPSLGATSITANAIKGFPFNLKEPYHPNARWLTKRATLGALAILRDDSGATAGTGQYLWTPGLREGQGFASTLVGYPVSLGDDMPAVAAGALSMAFGDFREGYTIVRRLGITTLRDPYSAKPFVEFYSRMRVGGDVTNFEAIKLMVISAT